MDCGYEPHQTAKRSSVPHEAVSTPHTCCTRPKGEGQSSSRSDPAPSSSSSCSRFPWISLRTATWETCILNEFGERLDHQVLRGWQMMILMQSRSLHRMICYANTSGVTTLTRRELERCCLRKEEIVLTNRHRSLSGDYPYFLSDHNRLTVESKTSLPWAR